jgi:iron complex outermembrane receptor protein
MMYSARYNDRLWQRLGLSLSYQRMQSDGYSVTGIYSAATAVAAVTGPLVQAPPRFLTTTGTPRYQIGGQGDNWYNQHAFRAKADYTISSKTTFNLQFVQPRYQYGYDGSIGSVVDPLTGKAITSGAFTFNDGGLKRISITPMLFVAGPGGNTRSVITGSLLHTLNASNLLRISGGSSNSSDDWFALPSGSATFLGGPGTTTETPNRSDHGEIQWNWARSARQRYVFGTETRMDKARTLDFDLNDFAFRDSRARLTKTSSGLAQTSALYGQLDYKLAERVSLVVGARYDYWRTYGGRAQAGPTEPLTAFPARDANAVSAKAAVSWDAGGGWTVRAAAGNAFRAPTLINLYRASSYPPGTITKPNPDLIPERMWSGEFGFRKRFGDRVDLDTTYFENQVKNLIYTSTDLQLDPTGATRRNFNAGRSHTRGVEIAFRQRATSWLRVSETYTLNDARITRNDFIPLSVGRYVPYVPRNVGSVSILANRGGWTGSLSGRYAARTFNSDTNTDYVKGVPGSWDPFVEIEATAGYRFKRYVSVFASANNLLNRQYYQFYLSPGRTISVGLTFRADGAN